MKNKQKKTAFSPLQFNQNDRDLLVRSAFNKFVIETSKTLECPLSSVVDLVYSECSALQLLHENDFYNRYHRMQNELQCAVRLVESGQYINET